MMVPHFTARTCTEGDRVPWMHLDGPKDLEPRGVGRPPHWCEQTAEAPFITLSRRVEPFGRVARLPR
jgi:hypothetical protein